MNKILFHPNISMLEAAQIAHNQGGRLVWREEALRIPRAMEFKALAEIEAQNYAAALVNIRAARAEVEGGTPCAA